MTEKKLSELQLAMLEVLIEFPQGLTKAELYQKVSERGFRRSGSGRAKMPVKFTDAIDTPSAAPRAANKPVSAKKVKGQ